MMDSLQDDAKNFDTSLLFFAFHFNMVFLLEFYIIKEYKHDKKS